MPNPRRGEIACMLDGKPLKLCLTLGALAELEHAFGHDDMLSLAQRFQSGRLSARDAQRIIAAGLRGAGHEFPDDAVGRMQAEGGVAGFVDIVARLLAATFGGEPDGGRGESDLPTAPGANLPRVPGEGRAPAPFPGTT
jgi:hypothetical protein